MTHRILLFTALAGLLGAQAQVCMLACTSDAEPQAQLEMARDVAQEMPCHDSDGPIAQASDAGPPGDCGCSDLEPALLAKVDSVGQRATTATTALLLPHGIDRQLAAPHGISPARVAAARHVPPDDVLLLKSTLLI